MKGGSSRGSSSKAVARGGGVRRSAVSTEPHVSWFDRLALRPSMPLLAVPVLHLCFWGLYAALRRPAGDFSVETDFFGDYIYWAREWASGHASAMSGFKGPVYYILLGYLSRFCSWFAHGSIWPPPPGIEFAVGKALSVLSAAGSVWLVGVLLVRLLRDDEPAPLASRITPLALGLALAAQAALSSNLIFIDHTYRAGTDAPALFLLLLAFERSLAARSLRAHVLAGALAAIAVLTRSSNVGVLIPLLLIAWRRYPRSWRALGPLGGYIVVSLPWWIFLGVTTGNPFYNRNLMNAAYEIFGKGEMMLDGFIAANLPFESATDLFRVDPGLVAMTWLKNLPGHLGFDWVRVLGWPGSAVVSLGAPKWSGVAIGILSGAPFWGGYVAWLLRGGSRRTPFWLLAFLFAEVLVLLPIFYGERFALPVLPIYVLGLAGYYFVPGSRRRQRMQWRGAALTAVTASGVLLVALSYAAAWRAAEDPDRYYQPREILSLVRNLKDRGTHLEAGASIAARKPHSAYFLGLRSAAVPDGKTLEQIHGALVAAGVRYLYVGSSEAHLRPVLVPLANPGPDRSNPDGFRQIEGGTSHDGRQLFGGTLWEVDGAVTRPAIRVEVKVARRAMPPGVSRTAFVQGELGRTYLANARLAPALKLLTKATRAAPSWMAAKLAFGDALYFNGRPEDALGCYRAASEAMPDSGIVYARLATVYLALGRREDTEASMATTLALAGFGFDKTTDLGVRYFGRREYVAAIAPLYASLKREPKDWRAQEYLGLIAYQSGNVGAALPRFRACLEWAPSGAERTRILGLVETIERYGGKSAGPRPVQALDSPE